jgi:hypothetical protein
MLTDWSLDHDLHQSQRDLRRGQCFLKNAWYYLKPPSGSHPAKYLRFRFLSGFVGTASELVDYRTDTKAWSVDASVPYFEYQLVSAKVTLPSCH